MPKVPNLEKIKKTASQLSAEERLELFDYLARLPDSGLIYHPPVSEPLATVLPSDHTQEVLTLNSKVGWKNNDDGSRSFSFEGREVFRIKFDPSNYAESNFQKLKDYAIQFQTSGEARTKSHESIREFFEKQGITPTQEQVEQVEKEALRYRAQSLLRDSLTELANNIDERLNDVTLAILAKIVQTSGFSVANLLRDTLGIPEQKVNLSDVQSILYKHEFDRLKSIVGLQSTQGGARNIKHAWTDKDKACLSSKYSELLPIWQDAKIIAVEAQKSRAKNRKEKWRQEVLSTYPNLPTDLLESFSAPRGVKPSDNAILHASRECKITEGISIRRLHEIVTEWNEKSDAVQT
jgi:hypothetical protein